jgi:FkbM family methyltransferase
MPTFRQTLVSSLTRLYPFYSGCGTLANSSLVQKLAGTNRETTWAHVRGGEVLAPLADFVGRAAYYTGDLDRKITWICSKLIRPGDTVLDIGANIGLITVLMARLVGQTGHVHAFEPNPMLVQLLRDVIEHNGFEHVRLHPVALGSHADTLDLYIPRNNCGSASLVRRREFGDCDLISVSVEQLSNIATQNSIRSVRLIKIDVEGFEAEVLRGARTWLQSTRPDAILFELNEHIEGRFCEHPLIEMLTEHDYGFAAIPRQLVRMRLKLLDPANVGTMIGHDLLAVARGDQYHDILARVNAVQ